MENSQLVILLKSMDARELRAFRKWLLSPFHNQREDVIDLFDYIMYRENLHREDQLEKEKIFKKIFPDTVYDDARLRQTVHFLMKALEGFLTYQEFSDDEAAVNRALAAVYRRRQQEKSFLKTIRNLEKIQEASVHRGEEHLRNEFLLHWERYKFYEGKKRSTDLHLQEVSDNMDIAYIASRLRQSCLMLAHQKVYKMDYDMGMMDATLQYLETKNLLHIPAIAIFYHGYKAFTNEQEESHFRLLKQAISAHSTFFPPAEVREIYLMAINYCISRMNTGQKSFVKEAFELYRLGVENEVLIENGLISRFTFRNIINTGTPLKEFDWLNHFVEKYQGCLEEKHRHNLVTFSLAKIHFEKREYRPAMQLLAQFEDDDMLTNLYGKAMLIQMYYEEDEYDALESLLESMRAYLKRKQVISYHKDLYSNLIKYTRKLVKINPYNQQQKEQLADEIKNANPLPIKNWLLLRLAEISQ
ncbi:MAG: hypothetical protein NWS63_10385 [Saprospiraceae bacterium]|jgi:hypothetical protein|nr:hypothetical protein [Saprospiraceae bacterium]MDP5000129.1 hypothetical protein [Saprospiraceae bacterium]